ncbi:hypothetical protein OEW28_13770 [Defluviimonas sp. WL0002]|uniref:Uncharacterized protein n=1 Tax=Albidovulum marisflavi TaxID=2984159 RepID=A0ABT2ZF16_9RHOB|nr:hypothetical protein [Defluviimonas sp. WL0002]MCV2869697.1 hypothetical protein [Defluviimonas sp. WL0002]
MQEFAKNREIFLHFGLYVADFQGVCGEPITRDTGLRHLWALKI